MILLEQSEITTKHRAQALTLYMFLLVFLLSLLVFTVPYAQVIYKNGVGEWLSCSIVGSVFILCGLFTYAMKLPKKCFGFITPTKKSIVESLAYSVIFCCFVIVIKYFILKNVDFASNYPLIEVIQPSQKKPESILWLNFFLYSLFVPLQVLIFHSAIEGPMIDLTNIKYKGLFCIFTTVLFFECAHDLLGMAFAILVLLPAIIWSILYYKNRCIWSIIISHVVIGGVILCLVGVEPFLLLITHYLL